MAVLANAVNAASVFRNWLLPITAASGWHVSYRDAATGLPRKHRFGDVPEDRPAFSITNGLPSIWRGRRFQL